jgi:hypothetical protein
LFGKVFSALQQLMPCGALTFFCATLQKALQTRDAASLAATEALQEASAAESVLRGLRQVLGAQCIAQITHLQQQQIQTSGF